MPIAYKYTSYYRIAGWRGQGALLRALTCGHVGVLSSLLRALETCDCTLYVASEGCSALDGRVSQHARVTCGPSPADLSPATPSYGCLPPADACRHLSSPVDTSHLRMPAAEARARRRMCDSSLPRISSSSSHCGAHATRQHTTTARARKPRMAVRWRAWWRRGYGLVCERAYG